MSQKSLIHIVALVCAIAGAALAFTSAGLPFLLLAVAVILLAIAGLTGLS